MGRTGFIAVASLGVLIWCQEVRADDRDSDPHQWEGVWNKGRKAHLAGIPLSAVGSFLTLLGGSLLISYCAGNCDDGISECDADEDCDGWYGPDIRGECNTNRVVGLTFLGVGAPAMFLGIVLALHGLSMKKRALELRRQLHSGVPEVAVGIDPGGGGGMSLTWRF
jgi:hypothetical protein